MNLSGLTKKQKLEMEEWLKEVADLMHLRDWNFEVMWDDPLTDHRAGTTNVQPNSKRARLYFAENFLTHGERRCREIAVHEMMHWHWEQLMEFIDDYSTNEMGRKERGIYNSAAVQLMEYGVEASSLALAQFMPPFPVVVVS